MSNNAFEIIKNNKKRRVKLALCGGLDHVKVKWYFCYE